MFYATKKIDDESSERELHVFEIKIARDVWVVEGDDEEEREAAESRDPAVSREASRRSKLGMDWERYPFAIWHGESVDPPEQPYSKKRI